MNYLDLTNQIKTKFSAEWLTPSQKDVLDTLTKKFTAHKTINIYGRPGTGKTFLAWNLAKVMGATYALDIEAPGLGARVILDNCKHAKHQYRTMLLTMHLKGVTKLVLITDKKIPDDITSLELSLTDADKQKFKNNLWKLCDMRFTKEKPDYNMHALIKFNV